MYQIHTKTERARQSLDDIYNLMVEIDEEAATISKESNKQTLDVLAELIREWSIDRNLHTAQPIKQMAKVREEVRELDQAIERWENHRPSTQGTQPNLAALASAEEYDKISQEITAEIKDAVGDTIVTLTILCQQLDLSLIDCLAAAYEEIKDRKGKLINGTFIKEGDTRCVKCGSKGKTILINGGYFCDKCASEDDYMFYE